MTRATMEPFLAPNSNLNTKLYLLFIVQPPAYNVNGIQLFIDYHHHYNKMLTSIRIYLAILVEMMSCCCLFCHELKRVTTHIHYFSFFYNSF